MVQGVEGQALSADGAHAGEVEGVEVVVAGRKGAAVQEAVVDALGAGQQVRVGGQEGELVGVQIEDELDESGPLIAGEVETGAEIEEVELAGATGGGLDVADEAIGGVGGAGGRGAGGDLADEHATSMGERGAG